MHHTSSAAAAYMYRPSYAHIHSDAGVDMPRYRRDSEATHYTSTNFQHQPWHQMAHAYAWVDEHDYVRRDNHTRKTEQWVLEQRVYSNHVRSQPIRVKVPQKTWEDAVCSYEPKEDEWKRRETEIRHRVLHREVERARLVQEEMRRTEERIRHRREAERQRIVEERARIYVERRERARLEKAMADAWTSYESQWAAMLASTDTLTFSSIPWPLLTVPDTPDGMEPADIASFLLSTSHSTSQTRRERIRAAQLRWHPDRFVRLMDRVAEVDRAAVEEAVGVVARCLNDLMAREKSKFKIIE